MSDTTPNYALEHRLRLRARDLVGSVLGWEAITADLIAASERMEAMDALIRRYWCGDGPVGAGPTDAICEHIEALPADERAALLGAICDEDLEFWMEDRRALRSRLLPTLRRWLFASPTATERNESSR